jgi:hypothetical protein
MSAIEIIIGAAGVLRVTRLSQGTDIILAFGRSWKINLPVHPSSRAQME